MENQQRFVTPQLEMENQQRFVTSGITTVVATNGTYPGWQHQ
jgi:hypothetical protein